MIEIKTDFDYKIRFPHIVYGSDEFTIVVQATPNFKGYNQDISDDCVCLDIEDLIHSLSFEQEERYPMTCECGYAEDVGINAPLLMINTGKQVYWELEIEHYRDILEEEYLNTDDKILRFVFDKTQYKQKVMQLIDELKHMIKHGVDIDSLTVDMFTRSYRGQEDFADFAKTFPHIKKLNIEEVNPNNIGGCLDDWIL